MSTDQITDNDKLLAALCYPIWLVAVFVLISESNKNRPFQRYHAVQALGLAVVAFGVYAVVGCLFTILAIIGAAIADALGTIIWCLSVPFWLIPLAVVLWFAYRAYQGEQFEIPYLTEFMKGQGWL